MIKKEIYLGTDNMRLNSYFPLPYLDRMADYHLAQSSHPCLNAIAHLLPGIVYLA